MKPYVSRHEFLVRSLVSHWSSWEGGRLLTEDLMRPFQNLVMAGKKECFDVRKNIYIMFCCDFGGIHQHVFTFCGPVMTTLCIY